MTDEMKGVVYINGEPMECAFTIGNGVMPEVEEVPDRVVRIGGVRSFSGSFTVEVERDSAGRPKPNGLDRLIKGLRNEES